MWDTGRISKQAPPLKNSTLFHGTQISESIQLTKNREFLFPTKKRHFSDLHRVQTGPVALPAPGVERPVREAAYLHVVTRINMLNL
jgi:hypothetical protein